jgi:hypothetical protein
VNNPYPENPVRWSAITEKLLKSFPVSMERITGIALASWEDIFHSRIGEKSYRIGLEIWPEPQIMGFLLHELIPLNLAAAYPNRWRRGRAATECDAVHIPNDDYSLEIKTSSSTRGIFGNRSYAHAGDSASKRRGSFFLVVNFGKFSAPPKDPKSI